MRKSAIFFIFMMPLVTACSTEAPIRKTNCWSTMALMPMDDDCEFHYVPAVQ